MTNVQVAGPPLGRLVAERLGVGWTVRADPYQLGLEALAGLALRRNPKRAQLIVSTVLAKHIAAPPAAVRAAGLLLAGLVQRALGGAVPELCGELLTDPARSPEVARLAVGSMPGAPVVIGFCETATALGHTVADAFTDSWYVHTTRRPDPVLPTLLGFDEEHSHAVAHHLQAPTGLLDHDRPVVLVDDEISTGTTALNTIAELHALRPRDFYVLATLLDMRSDEARASFGDRARELGVRVEVVALLDGTLTLPEDLLERSAVLQSQLDHDLEAVVGLSSPVPQGSWPAGVPTGGRHGFSAADRDPFSEAVSAVAASLRLIGRRVLVLGTEELMYAPVRLAHELSLGGADVLVQSTTRSPVLPLDEPGYAIRRRLVFASPDDPGRLSFLYNVVPPTWSADERYSDVVVVVEDEIADCSALVAAVRPWATGSVHLVALPS
ncbi:MAG: hypothetical protein QOI76_4134 [Frankiales bacterium]|nr:hypothetical protein [Frankiales bacterium]